MASDKGYRVIIFELHGLLLQCFTGRHGFSLNSNFETVEQVDVFNVQQVVTRESGLDKVERILGNLLI